MILNLLEQVVGGMGQVESVGEMTQALGKLAEAKEVGRCKLLKLLADNAPEPTVGQKEPPVLIDVKGAAAYLGVSTAWIYRHVDRLPHKKVGRRFRFIAAELARR